MSKKSKYYYDYTRNMSIDQIKDFHCGKPTCSKEECICMTGIATEKGTKIISLKEKVEQTFFKSNESWTNEVKNNG